MGLMLHYYKKKNTKLFFDTEFTGLHKGTTLISIGIVSPLGKCFYAEFTDYDKSQCNEWINDNVLSHTIANGDEETRKFINEHDATVVAGTKSEIKAALTEWLKQFDSVQFVADVCHYDFVLLTDIFGGASDLPSNVSPSVHDINQDIAKMYGISEREAFDKNRIEVAAELSSVFDVSKTSIQHNALYDAIIAKVIYVECNSNNCSV